MVSTWQLSAGYLEAEQQLDNLQGQTVERNRAVFRPVETTRDKEKQQQKGSGLYKEQVSSHTSWSAKKEFVFLLPKQINLLLKTLVSTENCKSGEFQEFKGLSAE